MYIRPISNPNSPVAAPKTDLQSRLTPQLVDFAQHQVAPVVGALQQWGAIRAGDAELPPILPPWDNWSSENDASRLTVFDKAIPDGVVLTHCNVVDDLEYRMIPTSNLNPVSLGMMLHGSLGTEIIDGKKQTVMKNYYPEMTKLNPYKASEAGRQATVRAMEFLDKGKTFAEAQSDLFSDPGIDAGLDTAAYEDGANRLRSKLNKVYIGDQVPKKAELRLVVHDVMEQAGERLTLAETRYAVLAQLRAMFCLNPGGRSLFMSEQTIRSVAAQVSAQNLQGRLVELRSKGLDPYQVRLWVTSSFVHQEVPDSNVIAVRIMLVEYESLYSYLDDLGGTQGPVPASGIEAPTALPKPEAATRPPLTF